MSGIFYDVQGTQTPHHPERGIARYVAELALGLGRAAPGLVEAYVYAPDLDRPLVLEQLRQHAPLVPLDDPAVAQARVYHVGSPFELGRPGSALVPLAVRRARARLVATLYDLIPLVFPHDYLPSTIERALYRRSLELVRACDAVVAISDATARDAERLLGIPTSRIQVIGAGASKVFAPPDVPPAELWAGLVAGVPDARPGFVLLPTGMDPRKNWRHALEAYSSLPTDMRRTHQLVVTCRLDDTQRTLLEAVTRQLGVFDDVVLTGVVDDDVLVALYRCARVVLFPSRYEGFGLPPLEARRCGAPVICGDNSSLREVVVDPAARFDADDPAAIARLLRRALTEPAFLESLRNAPVPPFTWDRAAARTAAVYRSLVASPRPRHRTRIGVVCSEPVECATARPDIEVTRFGPGGLPTRMVALADACGLLDDIVYVTDEGTPDHHIEAMRLRHPGTVVTSERLQDRLGTIGRTCGTAC